MIPNSAIPLIPVTIAEVVYVAFASTLDWLETNTDYPPGMAENMRKVLAKYNTDRTEALKKKGFTPSVIDAYTSTAAEKLAEWVDKQAAKNEMNQHDFNQWLEELRDE